VKNTIFGGRVMYSDNRLYSIKTSKQMNYLIYLNFGVLLITDLNKKVETKDLIKDKNIVSFAIDIDINDNIHILYYTTANILNYSIYYSQEIINTVFKKHIKYLENLNIKVIEDSIDIFYKTENLYKTNAILYYNRFITNKCIYGDELEIVCQGNEKSYFTDYYDKNLYLLYCNNCNKGIYELNNYYNNSDKLIKSKEKIVITDTKKLDFFVDLKNIGVITFNKIINSNSETLIKYKDFSTSNSEWSKEIVLLQSTINNDNKVNTNSVFHIENKTMLLDKGFKNEFFKLSSLIKQYEKNICNLQQQIDDYKKELSSYKRVQLRKIEDFKNIIGNNQKSISSLKKEKDMHSNSLNEKIQLLLDSLNDKDKIIADLYKLLRKDNTKG
jgi:hypothetical protein